MSDKKIVCFPSYDEILKVHQAWSDCIDKLREVYKCLKVKENERRN